MSEAGLVTLAVLFGGALSGIIGFWCGHSFGWTDGLSAGIDLHRKWTKGDADSEHVTVDQ